MFDAKCFEITSVDCNAVIHIPLAEAHLFSVVSAGASWDDPALSFTVKEHPKEKPLYCYSTRASQVNKTKQNRC